MSADSTPDPDPQPRAAKPVEVPPPAPTPVPDPDRVAPPLREAIRPRKVQPLRQEAEPEEEADDSLAAIGLQLQKLLGISVLPQTPAQPEPTVTAKNRRFASKTSPAPAPRAPLPAAFETADQTTVPVISKADAAGNPPEAAAAIDKTESTAAAEPGFLKTPPLPPSVRPSREAFSGQRRRQNNRARQVAIWAFLGLAAALVLSFFVGRASVPPPPSAYSAVGHSETNVTPKPVFPAWPAASLTRLDGIIATDRAGKVEEAFTAATALRKEAGDLPGLDLYLGNLQIRLMRPNDANVATSPMADPAAPPAQAAAAYDQMGLIYSRQRLFPAAIDNFSRAAADNPFRGEYYFHWAEALRRRGKPDESLSVFDKALDRLPPGVENDTLRECVALKSRLAAIEVGQAARFRNDLADALKASSPTGYWLLTGAAVALQENRLPDAVDALRRAKAVLPPGYFDILTADYFFRGFALNNETLSSLLMTDDAARKLARRRAGDYFIDP